MPIESLRGFINVRLVAELGTPEGMEGFEYEERSTKKPTHNR
jgi:hypothetical protein